MDTSKLVEWHPTNDLRYLRVTYTSFEEGRFGGPPIKKSKLVLQQRWTEYAMNPHSEWIDVPIVNETTETEDC